MEIPMTTEPNLKVTEIKAFVPAKDFEFSKQFYKDIGFTLAGEGGGVAYFRFGNASFLLSDFYEEGLAGNLMMHLLVQDVDAWWAHIAASNVVETYGLKIWDIELHPWRMRDFCMTDPTGVLWRIGQNVE